MKIYLYLIWAALAVLLVIHLFRKQWKPAGSVVAVAALSLLPMLLGRWLGVHIDPVGQIVYPPILIMTLYLGNSMKLYDRFTWWDKLIHLLSGLLFVNFGIAFAKKVDGLPALAAVTFAFCFSLTLHCIWELLEYGADCLLRSDNQRWQAKNPDINHKPAAALQPAGLVDTMNDLLMGFVGAAGAAAIWYPLW